ncbi:MULTISPECIES: type IX secretion system sortase PorU [unclassified Spirosoma]|uniref:type IX secretion system sortase PorU n=2 Tax=Spirosoma TaxID=107 RepID=UPI0025FD20AD|nr:MULTISPECIES: type IX secretion system sortase PorU [unclassified Spirosoma]
MSNEPMQRQLRWAYWLSILVTHLTLSIIHYKAHSQSVLREGIWVKIAVTESGVYRLSQAQLTKISPAFSTADPRKLRLYGNGGAVLPQSNAIARSTDLTENAIQVIGEADGRFDAEDYVLFFGQSPHVVRYDSVSQRFTHQINPYSDTTFYFLTIGTSAGLRITERSAGAVGGASTVTTFNDYQFHEQDLTKVPAVRSGREWLGEYLTTDTTKVVSFDVPGLVANTPIRLTASVVAGATVATQFRVQLNDQQIGTMPMAPVSGYEYDYQGIARTDTFLTRLAAGDSPIRLAVTFRKNGLYSAQGYLNYLGVQTQRELRQVDRPTWVRRSPAGQYKVRQASSSLRIWDITNPLAPISQAYELSASQEAGWGATKRSDYFLFTDTQLLSPVLLTVVANQNIRSQDTPDLLIVTPASWKTQADRLAQFRRDHDQLSVIVVTTQQLYNEFGSGLPDPTAIRDMARYFYQKQPTKLRYLLLFGDATYDYRNIAGQVSASQLANMVPVYESRESLHPVLSYSSDDYFGFMDVNEGEWPENDQGDYRMDIGVGRLPVKSVDEAQTVVDKLIRYSSDPSITGDWQTKVMFVADDGDYNIHQQDADQMAKIVERTSPAYRPERIFLDDFVQENTSSGQKAPLVNQVIDQAVTNGRLIINYSGHGGIVGLADEQIVTLQDILGWRNSRLPLFVTATCQFGRYDDPSVTSGAELTLLSRTGGGIGLLTTTRPVYANTNLLLNEAFYNAVFTPINGQMPRLGDVMRLTKNNSLTGPVNRNFALLGDPSMRLAYPKAQAVLTQVNGKTISANRIDTLHALQTVDLTGQIQQAGQQITAFTGTVRLSLYDKAATHTTLGSEAGAPKMTYQAFSNPIFTGQIPVQQGQFTARFTIPKDIDYTVGNGKLYLYAVRADSLLDAVGSYDSLRIGGSVFTDSIDTQPPSMTLAVVGGTTAGESVRIAGPDVTLRILLKDNRGINIARSGLGHELTAQLASQPAVILNDNYVANGADGRQGEALYTFRNLSAGQYTVRVKAWDINNNSSEGTLTIIVSDRPGLALRAFRVSPNPMTELATLTAELNRSGEPLDWVLSVYDLSSRLLSQKTGQCTNCDAAIAVGSWNGRTDAGQLMPNGLYIVRLDIRSAVDETTAIGTSRIVITR